MKIFRSMDHRAIVKQLMQEFKDQGIKFSYADLARTAGVQKTYVSKVMSEDACWSPDQAFAIAQNFKISDDETNYFCLLVELERAASISRKRYIDKQIKEIRRRNLRSQKALPLATPVEPKNDELAGYFADPYHSLAHVYLTIPRYQKGLGQLARALGISLTHLTRIVRNLEKMEVLSYDSNKDQIRLFKDSVHVPSGSPLVEAEQQLFRALAIDRIHRCSPERKNTFRAVFTGDASLQETVWAEFLEFLRQVESLSVKSASEDKEVYCLQFDLFPWFETEA